LPPVDCHESAVIRIELDANDEPADRQTVQRVIEILGRLDVVANAAGYSTEGAANDAQRELGHVQANLFGALWISQAALKYMRLHTGSRIIQVFGLESLENYIADAKAICYACQVRKECLELP
jgi:NAD(P)-dependent dehydrogenase (short-subunit alcohol dehydrogenase family)